MEKLSAEHLDETLKSSEYVILDFSSPGCAPCKKVPPLLEEIIGELRDKNIRAFEIDVTESPAIAQKYFIMGVPTIIIFKGGAEVARFNSVPKKSKLLDALE